MAPRSLPDLPGRLSPRKENQMPRSTPTRVVLLAVLILVLAAGSASAGQSPAFPTVKSISSYWSLLVCTILGGEKCSVTSVQSRTDVGCGLDPHGGACTPPATTSSDTGLGLDPHGGDGPK